MKENIKWNVAILKIKVHTDFFSVLYAFQLVSITMANSSLYFFGMLVIAYEHFQNAITDNIVTIRYHQQPATQNNTTYSALIIISIYYKKKMSVQFLSFLDINIFKLCMYYKKRSAISYFITAQSKNTIFWNTYISRYLGFRTLNSFWLIHQNNYIGSIMT